MNSVISWTSRSEIRDRIPIRSCDRCHGNSDHAIVANLRTVRLGCGALDSAEHATPHHASEHERLVREDEDIKRIAVGSLRARHKAEVVRERGAQWKHLAHQRHARRSPMRTWFDSRRCFDHHVDLVAAGECIDICWRCAAPPHVSACPSRAPMSWPLAWPSRSRGAPRWRDPVAGNSRRGAGDHRKQTVSHSSHGVLLVRQGSPCESYATYARHHAHPASTWASTSRAPACAVVTLVSCAVSLRLIQAHRIADGPVHTLCSGLPT